MAIFSFLIALMMHAMPNSIGLGTVSGAAHVAPGSIGLGTVSGAAHVAPGSIGLGTVSGAARVRPDEGLGTVSGI